MPYKTKKEDGKNCVYKKDSGKKVGCTGGTKKEKNKYLAALHIHEDYDFNERFRDVMDYLEEKKDKPSKGLSKKKKSSVVKKAKKGEDIGKKGKGFKKVADKAAKEYGSKEKGEKVAASAMWKNIKRK